MHLFHNPKLIEAPPKPCASLQGGIQEILGCSVSQLRGRSVSVRRQGIGVSRLRSLQGPPDPDLVGFVCGGKRAVHPQIQRPS